MIRPTTEGEGSCVLWWDQPVGNSKQPLNVTIKGVPLTDAVTSQKVTTMADEVIEKMQEANFAHPFLLGVRV